MKILYLFCDIGEIRVCCNEWSKTREWSRWLYTCGPYHPFGLRLNCCDLRIGHTFEPQCTNTNGLSVWLFWFCGQFHLWPLWTWPWIKLIVVTYTSKRSSFFLVWTSRKTLYVKFQCKVWHFVCYYYKFCNIDLSVYFITFCSNWFNSRLCNCVQCCQMSCCLAADVVELMMQRRQKCLRLASEIVLLQTVVSPTRLCCTEVCPLLHLRLISDAFSAKFSPFCSH